MIKLEIVVEVRFVTAVDLGVIATSYADYENRLKSGNKVVKRLKSNDACSLVNNTNKIGAPAENGAPKTTDAERRIEQCGEEIEEWNEDGGRVLQ